MTRLAVIGIGANLPSQAGEPEETVAAAVRALAEAGRVTACSSHYRTEPVGENDQPAFVNAVAALETEMEARPLLEFLLEVERRYGRERRAEAPKGPRTLDLDLLLLGDRIIREPGLTVPHPELTHRRFVLEPLAEIAPELRHPALGLTVAELLDRLPSEGANRSGAVRKLRNVQGSL